MTTPSHCVIIEIYSSIQSRLPIVEIGAKINYCNQRHNFKNIPLYIEYFVWVGGDGGGGADFVQLKRLLNV